MAKKFSEILKPKNSHTHKLTAVKKCTPHLIALHHWKYNQTSQQFNFKNYSDIQKFACGIENIHDVSGGLMNLLKSIQDSSSSGFGLDDISGKMADDLNLAADSENLVQAGDVDHLMLVDNTKGIKDKKACSLLKKQPLTPELKIAWSIVKPLLIGKVPYFPSNFITDQIVKEGSKHFKMLNDLKQLAIDWEEHYTNEIKNWFRKNQELVCSRDLLEIRQLKDYLNESFLSGTGISSEEIVNFLSLDYGNIKKDKTKSETWNWQQILSSIDLTMLSLKEILECIDLDKFVKINPETGEKFQNETEMYDYAKKLAKGIGRRGE